MNYQKNTCASIKCLEVKVGQNAKQLADSQTTTFSANTTTNIKEGYNILATKDVEPNTDDEADEELSDLDRLVEYIFGERMNEIYCVLEDDAPQGNNVKHQIKKVLPYHLFHERSTS